MGGGVDRLMGGEQADCMWTDPPYGVSYVGKTKDALTIENDGAQGLRSLLDRFLTAASSAIKPGSPFYIAHPAGARCIVFGNAIEAAGWKIHQTLTWVKDSMVLGHSDYHYIHEPIYYGWLPGEGRSGRGNHPGSRWLGDHCQVSVFSVPRPSRSEEHPTMKPVALVSAMLRNSCPVRGLIYEPFGGSGTTLIAAESLGMRSSVNEIDPAYCDVILARWEAATGRVAELLSQTPCQPENLSP